MTLFLLLAYPLAGSAQIEITLRTSFIDSIKNRGTIAADYFIDVAHKRANSPSKDGDMHVAGRDHKIGLPIVAEIINAGLPKQKSAVDLIHAEEGSANSVSLEGAWRIWCEHAGSDQQIQGSELSPFTTTNPPHVFEIHPVTKLKDIDLLGSFIPIVGYQYKKAKPAFTSYENAACQLLDNQDGTVTILTRGVGNNYVEFRIEILSEQPSVDDARIFYCSVLDENDEVLVQKVRMIFIKGTPAEKKLISAKASDHFHVLGIPRIDLALVSYRIRQAHEKPFMLNWNLPYEMIIAATFPH